MSQQPPPPSESAVVRVGVLALPRLDYDEVKAEADRRGLDPLDLVRQLLAEWALDRRRGRQQQQPGP